MLTLGMKLVSGALHVLGDLIAVADRQILVGTPVLGLAPLCTLRRRRQEEFSTADKKG